MSKYAGTKTEKNLMDAFGWVPQARNKYTYYASVAKKAGYEQMAALYLETAEQEKEHAKMASEFHRHRNTWENLVDAAAGEDRYVCSYGKSREEKASALAKSLSLWQTEAGAKNVFNFLSI